MTDAAFLAALAETPDDAVLRAVNADFLDDAGRWDEAELLRADEAMRRVPVWLDEYWTLKNRRNSLRRLTPPEWRAATRLDGSRPDRVFRDGYPTPTRDRWRFLRAFVETWFGIEMPDVGGRADEVAAEERRLGLTFGPSLREWAALGLDLLAAPTKSPFGYSSVRFRMVDDDAIAVDHFHDPLTLAVAVRHAGEDDPPVGFYRVDFDDEENVWHVEPDGEAFASVTEMAFHMVGSELPWWLTFELPDEPGAALDLPGVLGVRWADYQRHSMDVVTVKVHPRLTLRDVPAEVWDLARRSRCRVDVAWRSDAEFAAAEAFFGDDPPQWFAQHQARRAEAGPDDGDDIPF